LLLLLTVFCLAEAEEREGIFCWKRRFWVHGVLKCHGAVGEFHRLMRRSHARAVTGRSNSGVYLDFLSRGVVAMLWGVADETHLANVPL